jgi:hypothetical protein
MDDSPFLKKGEDDDLRGRKTEVKNEDFTTEYQKENFPDCIFCNSDAAAVRLDSQQGIYAD